MDKQDYGLAEEELQAIRMAINQFADEKGQVNPKVLLDAMTSFGLDKSSPTIYNIFASFDKPEYAKTGISYGTLVDALDKKIQDHSSDEHLERGFEIMLGDSKGDQIGFQEMRNVADYIGDDLTDDEIKNMFAKGANNGKSVGYDEFCNIMTKKIIH